MNLDCNQCLEKIYRISGLHHTTVAGTPQWGKAIGSEDQLHAPLLSHLYSSAFPQFQKQVSKPVFVY